MAVQVLYFAWVRERIGTGKETVDQATGTVAEFLAHMATQSEGHKAALTDTTDLRVAVDQTLVPLDHVLDNPSEIAIFPPMTGG
ncbi:MAG: molybdopterin converting factor subunit 1 [Planktomarina sp.]